MKKKIGIITVIIIVVIASFSLIFVLSGLSEKERDFSWIAEVESFIEDVKPSEPIENWITVSGYRFSLIENGTQQILYHVIDDFKSNDEFVSYIRNLMYNINNIVDSSVDEVRFNEIIEQNKVLQVDFGTDTGETFWQTNVHTVAWFILEDNLNQNLEGTIFIKQQTIPSGNQELTLREIRK